MDTFSLCCYVNVSLKEVTCQFPKEAKDAFSGCNRMIHHQSLRISIWLLGLLAVLGNLAVIAWRMIRREDHPIQSCLLTNLALSDFLMGVYLMIISIQDQILSGNYFSYDRKWRSGELCRFAGALSVLSSEVSVLMLTVITAERLISIVFALKISRLTLRGAYRICSAVWIFGVAIAIVPMFDLPYFCNKDREYGYYGRSSVCLPLQLSSERLAGWEYSVAIFIVLNLAAFLFILAAYIFIILTVFKSQRRITSNGESNTSLNRESTLARRVFAIILTDFSCWVPVVILSILALFGKFKDPEGTVYVWFAVFVLPINSSVNPVLYTFSTPKVRDVLKGWVCRLLCFFSQMGTFQFFVCVKRNDKEGRGSNKEREMSVIMKELPSFNREIQPKNKVVSGVTNATTE
ncbi:G-protein coupled receptor GRL101-like [Porites lutea]|uniref:G-protein coupled receptor GRL101-like n=1 Tax=Porites lutea TaxID=51062 RepID=UPI003CC63D02